MNTDYLKKQQTTYNILCYGDSNTYGYCPATGGRYPKSERWVTILQNLLGDKYEVIPEGLNGRTTAYDRPDGIWKNGATTLLSCLGTHKPIDEIIFMLGTNDCNCDLNLSLEDIANGMEHLIKLVLLNSEEMQGYVPKITIVVPAAIRAEYQGTPFAHQLDDNSVKKSHDIAPLYKALAEKYECRFLDASDKLEVSKEDCEHLEKAGHAKLAELLFELIG